MATPTHDDAMLMLKLVEVGNGMGVGEAFGLIWADDFPSDPAQFAHQYPLGTPENASVLGTMRYFETTGTLVRNGLFNEDLLYDWLSITPLWERLKGIALDMRQSTGQDALWENFEYIAGRQAAWKPSR